MRRVAHSILQLSDLLRVFDIGDGGVEAHKDGFDGGVVDYFVLSLAFYFGLVRGRRAICRSSRKPKLDGNGDAKLLGQGRFYLFEPAIALAHLFLNSGRGGKLKCQGVVFKSNRLGSTEQSRGTGAKSFNNILPMVFYRLNFTNQQAIVPAPERRAVRVGLYDVQWLLFFYPAGDSIVQATSQR